MLSPRRYLEELLAELNRENLTVVDLRSSHGNNLFLLYPRRPFSVPEALKLLAELQREAINLPARPSAPVRVSVPAEGLQMKLVLPQPHYNSRSAKRVKVGNKVVHFKGINRGDQPLLDQLSESSRCCPHVMANTPSESLGAYAVIKSVGGKAVPFVRSLVLSTPGGSGTEFDLILLQNGKADIYEVKNADMISENRAQEIVEKKLRAQGPHVEELSRRVPVSYGMVFVDTKEKNLEWSVQAARGLLESADIAEEKSIHRVHVTRKGIQHRFEVL